MTAAELSERMPAAEFAEWRAFAAIEPFGSPTDDDRAAVLADVVGAPWGVRRPAGGWFERETGMPRWMEVKEAFGRCT